MRVHFIAVGGSVMHSLALALQRQGHQVTGSDDAIYDPARSRLAAAGLLPAQLGWFPERITPDLDAVIVGMHARRDNPELQEARRRGLPLYSFPSFMYEATRNQERIVVAGSHGKTTITSALLFVLRRLGIRCSYLVGACPPGYDAGLGLDPEADFAVFEGDEYPAAVFDLRPKFLVYRPRTALISGIAWDHANIYPTPEAYRAAFAELIAALPASGILVYNEEDEELRRLVETAGTAVRLQPYRTPPYVSAEGRFIVEAAGRRFPVRLLGRHNLQNLAGAAALAAELGVSDTDFWAAAAEFPGAPQRLTRVAEGSGWALFRDFAHAPSKVRATVAALREAFPERPLVACLELHTYSSLNPAFLSQYAGTLDAADRAGVFVDPEAARRKGFAVPSAGRLREAFGRPDLEALVSPGDVTLFLTSAPPPATFLLMSSGHLGGLDLEELTRRLAGK
ncbi:MAG: Mur ligase family protein [Acidobacteriota bacterium]